MNGLPVFPTTVIGSYPRPKWLREMIRLYRNGRIDESKLRESFDDAVIVTFNDQKDAGVDIPSDGEMRRDEMVEFFAEKLGFKFYGPVRVWGTAYYRKPSVVTKVEYKGPMTIEEFKFAKEKSYSPLIKFTITGAYTIMDWSYNEYYKTRRDLAFDLAKVINLELRKLKDEGLLVIQVDEPALATHPSEMEWGVEVINEEIKGVNIKVILHACYGNQELILKYAKRMNVDQLAIDSANRNYNNINLIKKYNIDQEIGFGVVDVHRRDIEDPKRVADAIMKLSDVIEPNKIWINPDCGLKLLPREIAKAKLISMVQGANIARSEIRDKAKEPPTIKPLINR
jgi:Methionine synthase II (cobalamin-independent)